MGVEAFSRQRIMIQWRVAAASLARNFVGLILGSAGLQMNHSEKELETHTIFFPTTPIANSHSRECYDD